MPINDIVIKGWGIYKNNLMKFLKPLGIIILPYIVFFLINYIVTQVNSILTALLTLIVVLICIFVWLWMIIYMTKLSDALLKNETINEKQLFSDSMKRIASFFWTEFLVGLITLGGILLFIIPGIFWAIWYSYAPYANILEKTDLRGMKALDASKKLVKRRAWDVYGRSLFPAIYAQLAIYLIGLIVFILVYAISQKLELGMTIAYVIAMIASFMIIPLVNLFSVILYNNLKETRDINFDVQQPELSTNQK